MGRTAIVVGAGLGGLTAAVALRRCGWDVAVVERSPEPRTTGAGIVLLANALRALDEAGAGEAVRALGSIVYPGSLRDERGRELVTVDAAQIEQRLGTPAMVFRRSELQEAIAGHLEPAVIRYGARVAGIEPGDEAARPAVTLDDGERLTADLVVGADGVRGVSRAVVVPDAPEPAYVGSTTWLAITEAPGIATSSQTWGPGGEVGLLPLKDGRVYWYATRTGPAGGASDDGARHLAEARDAFAGWHEPIPAVIAGTRPDQVQRVDLYALPRPVRTMVRGRAALVGDAAHAMPPNVGQGGASSIEDAVVLAASVSGAPSVVEGLRAYDDARRPRTAGVLRAAWASARFGEQLRNPVAVAARNALLRVLPSRVYLDGMRRFTEWTPPRLPVG
ncbi:FAD-dependent monooxygenase [Myceligenerans pegani]|uniref:FAD-dependent monooxygenase n=1 Tax=Myceligenerans pegani TaxID=2776917 RepID=A0ABR9MTN0_9MICO|nr:FAD-dependent monooxygenase [Myceligenerans sp. TRM 65318]MBE1874253.1 FAD-dependent monooxygenase [Myceligenerans sp. TRM 65318]MBE3016524.1 FAD-dependent monooxygenase [Myceligenerans sp. TRM 65318]